VVELVSASVPAVSVVVPVFNSARCLPAAIASVQAQTFTDWEIVLVDDASTDTSPALIEALIASDPRIRAARLPANAGPAAARNRGLELARGNWIALLDADDAYFADRLAVLTALGASTGADLVSDNLLLADPVDDRERGLAWPAASLAEAPWIDAASYLASNLFHRREAGYGFMKPLVARAFIDRHGLRYDPALRLGEDYEFYWTCLQHGARWRVLETAHYRYHLTPGSATRRITPEQIQIMRDRAEAALRAAGDPRLLPLLRRRLRQLRGFHQHHAAMRDLKAGRFAAGFRRLVGEPAVLPFVVDALRTGLPKRLGLRGRHDHGF
jgi:glycosyltransferase involved in cell wall biosynthesis